MAGFINELKRRNVVRVAIAYVVVAWILIEAASVLFPGFGAPEWIFQVFATLVILGFPLALIFAWAFRSHSGRHQACCGTAGGLRPRGPFPSQDGSDHHRAAGGGAGGFCGAQPSLNAMTASHASPRAMTTNPLPFCPSPISARTLTTPSLPPVSTRTSLLIYPR